jgi:hypothetical protein
MQGAPTSQLRVSMMYTNLSESSSQPTEIIGVENAP